MLGGSAGQGPETQEQGVKCDGRVYRFRPRSRVDPLCDM